MRNKHNYSDAHNVWARKYNELINTLFFLQAIFFYEAITVLVGNLPRGTTRKIDWEYF